MNGIEWFDTNFRGKTFFKSSSFFNKNQEHSYSCGIQSHDLMIKMKFRLLNLSLFVFCCLFPRLFFSFGSKNFWNDTDFIKHAIYFSKHWHFAVTAPINWSCAVNDFIRFPLEALTNEIWPIWDNWIFTQRTQI